jgi:hypothetical protein
VAIVSGILWIEGKKNFLEENGHPYSIDYDYEHEHEHEQERLS